MTETNLALFKGTVDLLILAALGAREPLHGYGIAEWIERTTGGALLLEEGTLYPALHRMRRQGLVAAEWGTSENNRRARFYRLTKKGRARRAAGAAEWNRYATAVAAALGAGG
ncbi:MAG: PadR family transcriptional regulator [Longimicrobiales bacterium]|nr:PadR family transcriptional regulator [Longimicrobiales bacterium]